MMTIPTQPDDHPSLENSPKTPQKTQEGVSPGGSEAEAKGLPTSDREATETAANPNNPKSP